MKNEILVDLDVIVEYLKTGKGVLPTAYDQYRMKVPAVTYAELLASETFKDEALEKEVIDFLNKYFDVVSITDELATEAARIMRDSDVTLGLALTVAVAKAHGLAVLTGDKKAFDKVTGVDFVDM